MLVSDSSTTPAYDREQHGGSGIPNAALVHISHAQAAHVRRNCLGRQEILEAIRHHAESEGRPPGQSEFKRNHNVPPSAFYGMFWAKWSDAVREAGFEPLARPEATEWVPHPHVSRVVHTLARPIPDAG